MRGMMVVRMYENGELAKEEKRKTTWEETLYDVLAEFLAEEFKLATYLYTESESNVLSGYLEDNHKTHATGFFDERSLRIEFELDNKEYRIEIEELEE